MSTHIYTRNVMDLAIEKRRPRNRPRGPRRLQARDARMGALQSRNAFIVYTLHHWNLPELPSWRAPLISTCIDC